jgi:hypothetical protein
VSLGSVEVLLLLFDGIISAVCRVGAYYLRRFSIFYYGMCSHVHLLVAHSQSIQLALGRGRGNMPTSSVIQALELVYFREGSTETDAFFLRNIP